MLTVTSRKQEGKLSVSQVQRLIGLEVRAHPTRSVVSSKALAGGASLQDVCAVARFFIWQDRFYCLDMDSTTGSQVLQGWFSLSRRSTTVCTDIGTAPWHGDVGIKVPIVSSYDAMLSSTWKGFSQVTYVTRLPERGMRHHIMLPYHTSLCYHVKPVTD